MLTATFFVIGCLFVPEKQHAIRFYETSCIKPYDGYNYKTCNPIIVRIDDEIRTIPENFDTDLASIPRWYWSIASPNYAGFVAPAILHDYLYQCPNSLSRKEIDEIFYSALVENGVSSYTAYKMYIAVRLFGGKHYHHLAFCLYKNGINSEIDDECDVPYEKV